MGASLNKTFTFFYILIIKTHNLPVKLVCYSFTIKGARCSSVVRGFTHGVMGCYFHSSQCSTTGITKTMVCAILCVGWCI